MSDFYLDFAGRKRCGRLLLGGKCHRKAHAAELQKVIGDLMKACDELMAEFISKKRAADWAVINDALVAGSKARLALSKQVKHE